MKHIHHIIPKHMGGTDDPENLVELTIEQHAAAHKKLWEEHGYWEDEIAWLGLSGQIGKEEITARLLSEAGKKAGRLHKETQRENGRKRGLANKGKNAWNKGIPATPERLQQMRETCKPPSQKGKVMSAEQKRKIAEAQKARWAKKKLEKQHTT
jgi:hypothetical protein